MYGYAERLVRMLTGNIEQAATNQVWAYRRHVPMELIVRQNELQGVWGRAAPPAGSVRGAEPARMDVDVVGSASVEAAVHNTAIVRLRGELTRPPGHGIVAPREDIHF